MQVNEMLEKFNSRHVNVQLVTEQNEEIVVKAVKVGDILRADRINFAGSVFSFSYKAYGVYVFTRCPGITLDIPEDLGDILNSALKN